MDPMTQAVTSVVVDLLTGNMSMHPALQMLLYVLTAFLGLLSHWFKSKITGQHIDDIIAYFKNYSKDTILSIIAMFVMLGVASQTEGLTYMTAWFAGYACDSLFSRGAAVEETKAKPGE